eukprot:CAMPEP_0194205718 /NCGR_PEP_ID=MMETSP0156-20130528/4933_1 /TAXON_ID=33649 /ORGANISM="Thalassionema nitzschioides, Strain L26-B" /LENGTH=775 /DNA_ID=CAMNT_0038932075 /DNA_START=51 /DNA_END=2378 /DNA_ORIENTATION=-
MISLRGIVQKSDSNDEWKWSGMWTFGPLPHHVGRDVHSSQLKIPNVRPFVYTFTESCTASSVAVPSLEEEEEEEDKKKQEESKKGETAVKDNNDTSNETVKEPIKPVTTENDAATEIKSHSTAINNETKKESSNILKDDTASQVSSDRKKLEQGSNDKEKTKDDNASNDKEKDKQQPSSSKKKEEEPSEKTVNNDNPESSTIEKEKESNQEQKQEQPSKEKEKKFITFGDVAPGDPTYTEASSEFPDDCPKDGNWKGYFENIVRGRKAHNQVPERFSLFFNATPAKNASVVFAPDGKSPSSLTKGHIHARGVGTNQFGIFELLGSFDRSTKVLELQRMYIVSGEPEPPIKTPPKKKSSTKSTPTTASTSKRTSYSTRKRQLSWQRRSSLSDDEDEIVGLSSQSLRRPPQNTNKNSNSTHNQKRPRLSSSASDKLPRSSSSTHNNKGKTTSTSNNKNIPTSIVGPKKRSAAGLRMTTTDIELPLVGKMEDARWRAAHFLYYQVHENLSDDETTSTTTNNKDEPTPTFVVYEGEFCQGKLLRDGRGVCLYQSNGTLYEGDFFQNREHGYGTLYTSDRSKKIYEGEWERGKFQGRGIYYYHHTDARFEGEFKENCRHGVGKYCLPNQSTYDGEWRDDTMNGRGTFVWPDGSVYTGQWKEGKRHGQGLLRASDNFTYDGMWVENCMEGRGTATYPNGQTYEGLWHHGKREGRGTIQFTNGAVYEGRFRKDAMEGQGTLKVPHAVSTEDDDNKGDWMIPISFQSDMGHIHQKAGFTMGGD